MKIPVFITARLGSERLPHKMLLTLGGERVIEHVVRRALHFGFDPHVLIPRSDDQLRHIVKAMKVPVFCGDDDPSRRLIEASDEYGVKLFHQLDGDDPFFSEEAVFVSIRECVKNRAAFVEPPPISAAGLGLCGTTYNREIKEQPKDLFHLWEGIPSVWPQRLTLDYEEDYWLISSVNRMVGGYMAPRAAVDDLFRKNPDLHRVNFFRNEEWKARQDAERSGR